MIAKLITVTLLQGYAAIKYKSDVVLGPEHLVTGELSGTPELLESVQRNGFYSHPHCLIVAMLGMLIRFIIQTS